MNEKEFLKLYDDYIAKIYRFIYFRVNSEEEARDLTSEVFLKSWAHFKKAKSNNSIVALLQGQQNPDELVDPVENSALIVNPRAFLYQIARNLINDYYRQSAKKTLSLEEISDLRDISQDLSIKSIIDDEIEKIKEAIKQIKLEYQEIIIWRYIEEMEIAEIAQILGKKQGNVRVLISRALKALKQVLDIS